ncbi:50S ribosomal protein L3, partial [Bacillus sp. SIMBA_069]
TAPKRFVREIRGVNLADFEVGQELKADIFAEGDIVDVAGVSKGKGFAGSIKRHNQSRGPMASHPRRGPGAARRQGSRSEQDRRRPGPLAAGADEELRVL